MKIRLLLLVLVSSSITLQQHAKLLNGQLDKDNGRFYLSLFFSPVLQSIHPPTLRSHCTAPEKTDQKRNGLKNQPVELKVKLRNFSFWSFVDGIMFTQQATLMCEILGNVDSSSWFFTTIRCLDCVWELKRMKVNTEELLGLWVTKCIPLHLEK